MAMPDFMDRLNQYGPWYLLFFGAVGLLLSTVLHSQHTRLFLKFMESAMYRRLIEKENTPSFYRVVLEWVSRNVDAPFMRWLGIIQAVAMIVGGAMWLSYR